MVLISAESLQNQFIGEHGVVNTIGATRELDNGELDHSPASREHPTALVHW